MLYRTGSVCFDSGMKILFIILILEVAAIGYQQYKAGIALERRIRAVERRSRLMATMMARNPEMRATIQSAPIYEFEKDEVWKFKDLNDPMDGIDPTDRIRKTQRQGSGTVIDGVEYNTKGLWE